MLAVRTLRLANPPNTDSFLKNGREGTLNAKDFEPLAAAPKVAAGGDDEVRQGRLVGTCMLCGAATATQHRVLCAFVRIREARETAEWLRRTVICVSLMRQREARDLYVPVMVSRHLRPLTQRRPTPRSESC